MGTGHQSPTDPDDHVRRADKVGFVGSATVVDVKPGAVAEHTFCLQARPSNSSYMETFEHVAFHRAGLYLTEVALVFYGDVAGGLQNEATGCDGCVWTVAAAMTPRNMLVEVFGEWSVEGAGGHTERIIVWENGSRDQEGDDWLEDTTSTLPARLLLTAETIKGYQGFDISLACDLAWVCIEDRRDVWVTFSHDMDVPETFSAGPPPS